MPASFLNTATHPLAYMKQEGTSPTVMFCSGFKSDMTGTKAAALAAHCATHGQAFIRFDYNGHGQSGGKFIDGTIGSWKRDTLAVFDALTQDDVILVGSSMGAWMALMLALARPERIRGLIGISSAPDFTERLIWEKLSPSQKKMLLNEGIFYAPSCYGEEAYPITRHLIEEARDHLLLDKPIPITCPVSLLHGTADEDVPIDMAQTLAVQLPHAALTCIQDGNHRLSRPDDLMLLCKTLTELTCHAQSL